MAITRLESQLLKPYAYDVPAYEALLFPPPPPTPTSTHPQINSIVQERHSKVSFNVSWLEDLYEETLVEISGERVTPLVSNPGRIMLTSSRIYFQPYNNVEVVRGNVLMMCCLLSNTAVYVQEPVLKLKLSDLKYVTKRRYMLRHVVSCLAVLLSC